MVTSRIPDTDLMSSSEVSTPYSTSRPTSSDINDPGEPFGSFKLPPEALGLLENVITVNRNLEHQIEALRIRIDVDQKQYGLEKKKLLQDQEKKLFKKEGEIEELKDSLVNRDERIRTLAQEKEDQDRQISEKMGEIHELRDLVQQTEDYADKLSTKLGKLKEMKKQLESDTLYKHQNDEIRKLRYELTSIKDKLTSMESELTRAKNIIEQQNRKIRVLEFEKGEMNSKFKEELEKASRAMRQEVERMREVMKQQYEEMRNLREQNLEISSDVRDIKHLLMNNVKTPREPVVRPTTRETLNVNFKTTGSKFGGINVAPRSPKPVRSSMPAMKVGQSASANPQQQLPPIPREKESGKWIPSGNRKSMNAYSSRGKRK